MDGFGLNFRCPLRLKRAIEVLEQLPSEDNTFSRGIISNISNKVTIDSYWFYVKLLFGSCSATQKTDTVSFTCLERFR